jgi:long-chain acyl-CoA synthetase
MNPIWIKSYPAAVETAPTVAHATVAAVIGERCERYAQREAFWSLGRSMSFGECHAHGRALAAWLQCERLAAGDRVAIMLPNVLAFPVALFGALLGGYVVVTANPLYTPRELAHQLRDAGARTLIAWEPAVPVVERAIAEFALELDRLVVVAPTSLLGAPPAGGGAAAGSRPVRRTLESVLADGADGTVAPTAAAPTDPAFLLYTGGTTGVSKGAVLTHANVLTQQAQLRAWLGPFLDDGTGPHRVIQPLPLYHAGALLAGAFPNLDRGIATVLIADPRNLDGFVATLTAQPFTAIVGINTLYNGLLHHPRIREVDFSHCRFALAGAAATQPVVAERWRALTGLEISEIYGLTEACGAVTIQALDGRPFDGSVGLPIPLAELSIRDAGGRELGVGEPGEVCVRGPQVMAGYWKRPDETAKVMTADGYLRSGDIGSLDERGYLRISDRKKDMILVSGFNVFPNEVEAVLLAHPKVLEAAVVSVPDHHSGEAPAAFVVPSDPSLTEAELRAFCAEQLTAYKRPKRIEFRDALPKTPVGKILRRVLRDEAGRLEGA